ncbi:MAG: FMN-binding protein [Kiritimatiellia bacterium]|nr:FMN-binding protein [Kiritimatiellia bacterium]
MGRFSIRFLLFACMPAAAWARDPRTPETYCREWFGEEARLSPLSLASTNLVVHEVARGGQTAGWLFRTDEVPPACKGKRGQIALLVAIGPDTLIRGVAVLAHKEDARYFKKLKRPFFEQFLRRPPSGAPAFDAVTGATFSSRAIIRDVTESARNVIAQPEIAAKLNKGG